MDTSGYDPETGRTFTRAEPHEITHEGCVWTDEQIRALVPRGVARLKLSEWASAWKARPEGDLIPGPPPAAIEELTPSQVAERVLRCERCNGRGTIVVRPPAQSVHRSTIEACPDCESLRTLLLKLAGEGER